MSLLVARADDPTTSTDPIEGENEQLPNIPNPLTTSAGNSISR